MSEISRRSALKGAAWSVPVIAAAVATPMAAASGPGMLTDVSAAMRFSKDIVLKGVVTPSPLPTLEPEYFSVDGAPAVTVTHFDNYSLSRLDIVLHVSASISAGRNLTISIPGYETIVVPIT